MGKNANDLDTVELYGKQWQGYGRAQPRASAPNQNSAGQFEAPVSGLGA